MKHYTYHSPFKMNDKEGNEYTLTVEHDDCDCNPREWDNLCTMVCWHRRYRLGDKHNFEDAWSFLADLCEKVIGFSCEDTDVTKMLDELLNSKKIIIKPINLYDHGIITISTSNRYPYNDYWDTCCVGFIYVTKDKIFEECGEITESNWQERANEYLEEEVQTYDQYLRGDVYSFNLTKRVVQQDRCPHCGEVISEYEAEEEVDSCGGFFGDCLEENGMLEYLPKGIEFAEV